MSVTFKRVQRKNPQDQAAPAKYYPQLVVWGKPATLESLSIQMKEKSSLTLGDIQSVLTNFVSAMRTELYNGHSVSIDGFRAPSALTWTPRPLAPKNASTSSTWTPSFRN